MKLYSRVLIAMYCVAGWTAAVSRRLTNQSSSAGSRVNGSVRPVYYRVTCALSPGLTKLSAQRPCVLI